MELETLFEIYKQIVLERDCMLLERKDTGLEVKALLKSHARTVLERDGKEAMLTAMRGEMAATSHALTKSCDEVSQLQASSESINARLESLEKSYVLKSDELLDREKTMAENALELEMLQKHHVDLGAELKSAHVNLHEQAASIHSLKRSHAELTQLLETRVLEHRATVHLHEMVLKLEISLANLSAQFEGKCQEIQKFQAQMEDMVEEHTMQFEKMRRQHAAECYANLNGAREKLFGSVRAADSQLAAHTSKFEQQVAALRTHVFISEHALQTSCAHYSTMTAHICRFEEEVAALHAQLCAVAAECNTAKAVAAQQESEGAQKREEEAAALQVQLQTAIAECNAVKGVAAHSHGEVHELQGALSALQMEVGLRYVCREIHMYIHT